MTKHRIEFPDGFDDYAWESEAKGWLQGAVAFIDQRQYKLTFYDPTRLAQDIEDELNESAVFFERNLLVVPSVTRTHMEAAIDAIVRTGRYVDMTPEEGEPSPLR